ncbi:zinc ABC transporter ATPase [Microbacterium aurum]
MHLGSNAEYWEQVIRDMTARSTAPAPTEPGLYRMLCGECYIDFFIGSDDAEHWLVPGDPRGYTRENVAIGRHGDYSWERMYTLGRAATEILRRADEDGTEPSVLLEQLAAQADGEEAGEEEELAQRAQECTVAGESTLLADVADSLDFDLDED